MCFVDESCGELASLINSQLRRVRYNPVEGDEGSLQHFRGIHVVLELMASKVVLAMLKRLDRSVELVRAQMKVDIELRASDL